MLKTDNEALIENTGTLDYWRYLEYAKQILRTKASQNPRVRWGGRAFCLVLLIAAVCCMAIFFNPEGLLFLVNLKGPIFALLFVIMMPVGFVYMAFMIFQSFFPFIHLGSRFRTKSSQRFFTDASGIRRKEVRISTSFFEDRIVVDREGDIEESRWESIVEVAESKHFYFLILSGEVIDRHNAYIRSGIILQKDGFAKGSWEELEGYLAEYGSVAHKSELHADKNKQKRHIVRRMEKRG